MLRKKSAVLDNSMERSCNCWKKTRVQSRWNKLEFCNNISEYNISRVDCRPVAWFNANNMVKLWELLLKITASEKQQKFSITTCMLRTDKFHQVLNLFILRLLLIR